jgi:hypothetical protein
MPDTDTQEAPADYRFNLNELEYDCHDDHGGTIIVMAVSASGERPNIYDLGCAEDTWKLPGEYDDRRLVGTHWLTDEALQTLFPDDLDTYDVTVWREDCRTETCPSQAPALVVGIDAEGRFHLLCLECAGDVLANPGDSCNKGITLHGTHILTDETLHREFPEDFDEDE